MRYEHSGRGVHSPGWIQSLRRLVQQRFDCAVRRWHEAPTAGGYWTGESPSRGIQGEEGGGKGRAGQEVSAMGLTRDFKVTVVARVERDPAFAKELLDEATTLLISGEAETARVILRDLVNATLGFEQLAKLTDVPSKSLH